MKTENKIVNSLWIGKTLSTIELLTMASFLENGHSFRLWIYEPLQTPIPVAVEIYNAALILPPQKIFSYKNENKYGHGKGSVAGFSDIFRYKLLYENGGWWVDMDVTCLQPFDFETPYFFRSHHDLKMVGNVMKCPAGSDLMKACYEKAITTIDENNTDWHKPIQILNDFVKHYDLENFIKSGCSNEDKWEITSTFIKEEKPFPTDWFFVHWQNEEWRSRKIDKTNFYYKATLARLLAKYNLYDLPKSNIGKFKNYLKHIVFK